MNPLERRGTASLATIYGLRMLGLFMILPVFSLYAEGLRGVTPVLIGAALGVYGLTMAIFQIPFGMISDRIGRKPVITVGLLIFAAGSVVAAMADSIWGVIAGRALQGAGAIAAAMMALLADLTAEEERTKAMAIFGVAIGMSFTLALMVGPFLNNLIGVAGIFWLTAVLALVGVAILYLIVPEGRTHRLHRDVETVPGQLGGVLRDSQLLRLDFGIMMQHGVMMAMFTALPFVLRDEVGLSDNEQAWFYLPILVLSVAGMVPLIILAERKRKMRQVFLGSVALLGVAQLVLATGNGSVPLLAFGLFIFFVAFNVLEASLPSLISRMAPAESKGTAMGVYSTSQFFGAFVGGLFGGWIYGEFDVFGVFVAGGCVALVWLAAAWGMRVPSYYSTHLVHVNPADEDEASELARRLLAVEGVHEARVFAGDRVAYLKVDKEHLDRERLDAAVRAT